MHRLRKSFEASAPGGDPRKWGGGLKLRVPPAVRFSMLLFWAVSAWGAPERISADEADKYLIGLGISYWVPSHTPDFLGTQFAFGPRVAAPVGTGHVELDFNYGSASGQGPELRNLYCVELDYRWHFTIPYLAGFAVAGAHYTHYTGNDTQHGKAGPTTGFGLSFPMEKNFRMGLEMHGYLLETLVLSFGGNFIFAL